MNVYSKSLNISFNPSIAINDEYYATNGVYGLFPLPWPLYFYTKADRLMARIITWVCYWVVGMCWFSLAVGFASRKLPGIDTMFVVQWAWITTTWIESPPLIYLEAFFPLKYSVGYNRCFVSHRSVDTLQYIYPNVGYFGMDEQMLANNFNLSLLFMVLPIMGIFLILLIAQIAERRRDMKSEDDF
jgi:hypothetical protein